MATTVYAVVPANSEEFDLYLLFSTRELAHAWICETEKTGQAGAYDIEEWDVDNAVSQRCAIAYRGSVALESGEIRIEDEPEKVMWTPENIAVIQGPDNSCGLRLFAWSAISREHLSKLLAERRQWWIDCPEFRVLHSMNAQISAT